MNLKNVISIIGATMALASGVTRLTKKEEAPTPVEQEVAGVRRLGTTKTHRSKYVRHQGAKECARRLKRG